MAEQFQHKILCGPGQLHPWCVIASSGRNCTRRIHGYDLVHSDVGPSQRFWPNLPRLFLSNFIKNTEYDRVS
jgi:hypothetical protein